jgi:nicotinamidase-related amidase
MAEGKGLPPLVRRDTALIVVDMQNDFVREGAPIEVPDARRIIGKVAQLLTAFRKARGVVVFTKAVEGPRPELIKIWHPDYGPPTKACWPGVFRAYADVPGKLEGVQIISELAPAKTDLVVEKYGYNAFHRTTLTDVLQTRRIRNVVVCGTVTELCVEDTVRGAYHEGFRPIVVIDAVASDEPELHAAALRNLGKNFAHLMTTADVVGSISQTGDESGIVQKAVPSVAKPVT